ncbi:MAG TPA: hypothetical protein VEC11_15385 [Allosphingosinicella sp.]|nr:hypothetical protein [Allosphingosinicella sp.]
MTRLRTLAHGLGLAGLLTLAACGNAPPGDDLSAIDNELIANSVDPALTTALQDQLSVDPTLAQQTNPNSARPPEAPVQAQYPADANPGEDGSRTRTAGGTAQPPSATSCGRGFDHGNEWANRMPAEFPAYPGGRLTEAAGNDHGGCRMRVVSFTTADAPARVIERYRGLVTGNGYSAEQQQRGSDQVLGGTRGESAYYLIVTPQGSGSDVSLIVNNGR